MVITGELRTLRGPCKHGPRAQTSWSRGTSSPGSTEAEDSQSCASHVLTRDTSLWVRFSYTSPSSKGRAALEAACD